MNRIRSSASILGFVLSVSSAIAAPGGKRAPTPRDVQVDTVKEAYWNRTNEGEIEVVQNRQYSKKNRLSLAVAGGTVSTDPFLNVKSVGGALGFHFSETLGVSAVYRKYVVSNSNYLDELQSGLITGTPSTANTNRPNSFMGGEIEYSPLYGKISLSGASIVHYDAHILLGAGMTDTDSGKYFTPTVGFGPQFYLGNSVAIRMDYRLAVFKETIRETVLTSRPNAGERTNYSHQVSLGLVLFL
ncbi:MAG: outer membrane beta-barrel domain-containing protein [Cryobacterium sp.]|nr:outer membrane beta-barrel domain-containing protein [Oligoflexia bacterium]